MSYSIREPYRKLMSLLDASDSSNQESLNNFDVLYILVPIRLIILLSMIWVYTGEFDVKESMQHLETQWLIIGAVFYALITIIPVFWARKNPLIVLNRTIFIGTAIFEILLLGLAFWGTGHVESPIFYFVLIPLGTITRMKQIRLSTKLVIFSAIIVTV